MNKKFKNYFLKNFILAFFLAFLIYLPSVFMHELGHYIIAKEYGCQAEIHLGARSSDKDLLSSTVAYITYWDCKLDKNQRLILLSSGYFFQAFSMLIPIGLLHRKKANILGYLTFLLVVLMAFMTLFSIFMPFGDGLKFWELVGNLRIIGIK